MLALQVLKLIKKRVLKIVKNTYKVVSVFLLLFCFTGHVLFSNQTSDNNKCESKSTIYVLDARNTDTPGCLATDSETEANFDDIYNGLGGDGIDINVIPDDSEMSLVKKIKLVFVYAKIVLSQEKENIIEHIVLHRDMYCVGALVVTVVAIAGIILVIISNKNNKTNENSQETQNNKK